MASGETATFSHLVTSTCATRRAAMGIAVST